MAIIFIIWLIFAWCPTVLPDDHFKIQIYLFKWVLRPVSFVNSIPCVFSGFQSRRTGSVWWPDAFWWHSKRVRGNPHTGRSRADQELIYRADLSGPTVKIFRPAVHSRTRSASRDFESKRSSGLDFQSPHSGSIFFIQFASIHASDLHSVTRICLPATRFHHKEFFLSNHFMKSFNLLQSHCKTIFDRNTEFLFYTEVIQKKL